MPWVACAALDAAPASDAGDAGAWSAPPPMRSGSAPSITRMDSGSRGPCRAALGRANFPFLRLALFCTSGRSAQAQRPMKMKRPLFLFNIRPRPPRPSPWCCLSSCKPGALPRIHTVTSSLSRMLVCRIHSKSDAAPQRSPHKELRVVRCRTLGLAAARIAIPSALTP